MKISQILFTLCAASTPLCHSMQLAFKTNNGIKQIPKIALQKEFYVTSTKQKKQKEDNQCNNCCIVTSNGQIKDLIAQSTDKLQSHIATYSSKFFTGNERRNKLISANLVASIMHASFAIGASDPGLLLPISINAFFIAALRSKLVEPQQNMPPLAADIMGYVNEMAHDGRIDDISKTLHNIDTLKLHIKRYVGTKGLHLKSVAELNESKATLGNELCKPILPIFKRYNDVDIQESIVYMEKMCEYLDNAGLLSWAGAFLIFPFICMLPEVGVSPLGISILANSLLFLPSASAAAVDNSATKNLNGVNVRIVKDLIKTYKEHRETEKDIFSTISPKTSKKKRNTE